MNRSTLQIIYIAFVLVMMSMFFASSSLIEVGKLFLLVVLSYMLFDVTTKRRGTTVYHHFNILFAISVVVFVVYALLFRGDLYPRVRLEFLALSLIGLAMSLMYSPKRRRVVLPPRPVQTRPVKKTTTKKARSNKVTAAQKRKVSRVVAKKKAPKKVAKRKVAKKKSSKRTAPKRKMVRKGAKKKVTKKKTAKKKVAKKKTTKKKSSRFSDHKMISFSQDHEVAYVLRKNKKRITKDNKATLIGFGKKFRALKSYKPHDRASFYKYMKDKKVLSKLK